MSVLARSARDRGREEESSSGVTGDGRRAPDVQKERKHPNNIALAAAVTVRQSKVSAMRKLALDKVTSLVTSGEFLTLSRRLPPLLKARPSS